MVHESSTGKAEENNRCLHSILLYNWKISIPIYVCVYDIIFYYTDSRVIEKWWHVKQKFCRESGVPVN